MKIKQGDTVIVITGKDKGKEGLVTKTNTEKGSVVVEGVNMCKKAVKPKENVKGGIISFEKPINVSNVMLKCPHTGKKTRVSYDKNAKGKKVRVSKVAGKVIK